MKCLISFCRILITCPWSRGFEVQKPWNCRWDPCAPAMFGQSGATISGCEMHSDVTCLEWQERGNFRPGSWASLDSWGRSLRFFAFTIHCHFLALFGSRLEHCWSALYWDCHDIAEANLLATAIGCQSSSSHREARSSLRVEGWESWVELKSSKWACWKTRHKKGTSSWVAESLVQGQGHISLVNINWKGMETGQTFWFVLEPTGVARCWHTAGALLFVNLSQLFLQLF